MEISQSAIGLLYLYAFLLGAALGFLYDIFRLTRIFLGLHYSRSFAEKLKEVHLPHLAPYREREESRALGPLVFLEDLIFCLICGLSFVLLFYEANRGIVRIPAFLSAGVGFFLYRATLGRAFLFCSEGVAFAIETAVRYLTLALLFPFRKLWALLRRCGRLLHLKIQSHTEARDRVRFTRKELRRLDAGMGLFPSEPIPGRMKKVGGRHGRRDQKEIQSDASFADLSHRSRSAFGGRVRNRRDEVQPPRSRREDVARKTRTL